MILHVAEDDLKPNYRPVQDKESEKRIIDFLKSIKETFDVPVYFELKEHNTAAFTIVDQESVDKKITRTILDYLLEQLCDPTAVSKYSKVPPGPNKTTPSQEAIVGKLGKLSISNLEAHETSQESGPRVLRQFACLKCRHSWWHVVPEHKQVSRCRAGKCNACRYDPVPRNEEFGIGRYYCQKCDRFFFADCEFIDILDCRVCKQPCNNPIIHPKWTKRRRRGLNPNAKPFKPGFPGRDTSSRPKQFEPPPESFFRDTREPNPGGTRRFVPSSGPGSVAHTAPFQTPYKRESVEVSAGEAKSQAPRRIKRKHAFNPSSPHKSTGSTISTNLPQCDDQSECDVDYDDDKADDEPYPRRFECSKCQNKYTVKCKMSNTAQCYKCGTENPPLGPASADEIQRTTSSKHSCSECPRDGRGRCPNL